jgi:hypothetical protein
VSIRRTSRKALLSQAVRWLSLALVLPMSLLAPGHAEAVVLHSHCSESLHLHTLRSIETVAWLDAHAGEHHCAGMETDACCESGAPGDGRDGIVLRSVPMLACRAGSIETAPPQPAVDIVLPAFATACVRSLRDPMEAPEYPRRPRRCIDALLLSSHALLI